MTTATTNTKQQRGLRLNSPKRPVVFITGASSGIGEALARQYASRGASLILCARRMERLETLVEDLESPICKAIAVTCDVTNKKSVEEAVRLGREAFGCIDVVIANAGFGVVGKVMALTEADYRRQLETNFFGVLNTVWATVPSLRETKGKLGIVGSVLGFLSLDGNSPYTISKFAVRALAYSLYFELGREGISVTHIAPGMVRSEIRRLNNQGILVESAKDPIPEWISMPAEVAAKKIARAIELRKQETVITTHGKMAVFFARHFQRLFYFLLYHLNLTSRPEP